MSAVDLAPTPAAASGQTSEAERDHFWTALVGAGGRSEIPRWVGSGSSAPALPAGAGLDLRRAVDALGAPPEVVLVAAHGYVLSRLNGESEVVLGLQLAGCLVPVRLSVAARSWQELVASTAALLARVRDHLPYDVAVLAAERNLHLPRFDSAVDLDGDDRIDPAAEPVAARLRLPAATSDATMTCDPAALDATAAERLRTYHRRVLAAMQQPDQDPADLDLVDAVERELQLTAFRGPDRTLPDRRLHQLIEDRVRRHPDRAAATCGTETLDYAELNARANRLAHRLLSEGLGAEDVVAVVTERNLTWLAAVLAIFKAGGCYLPIEPGFPAARIATSLSRADCRFVITEPGSVSSAGQALELLPEAARPTVVDAVDVISTPGPDADPAVAVGPEQLAYIYFTSGSTGEPKGAMCEHAGMVNHMLAKIEDLGLGEHQTLAQTAPQCFDISLWQLLAALMAGGRTLIIEQATILDLPAMVERVRDEQVAVWQLVPSYLEVVLTQLDAQPRELPTLHTLSVTGEAIKPDLVRRFFAHPCLTGRRLVNAYGLTETCDDTNHAVLTQAPHDDRVPLGRAIRNVTVYVLDAWSRLAPLGAPGEIAFSGVCVGRGYVNDPQRTAAAFGADPVRPGQRLYRSGDFGRWRPDGNLEFLGRRDSQLKIAGFRIELGEIESTLLRVPGVRDGAVVVVTDGPGGGRLIGFYRTEPATGPSSDQVRETLSRSLPGYMVPAVVHRRASLPLSANGKIDRKALVALAAELAGIDAGGPPPRLSPAERRVAAAWGKVLGVDPDTLSPTDHFVDRGGTSLSAVKVIIALDRLVELPELIARPVLADLAALLAARLTPDHDQASPDDPTPRDKS